MQIAPHILFYRQYARLEFLGEIPPEGVALKWFLLLNDTSEASYICFLYFRILAIIL